jgi:hypothetical protein
MILRLSTQPDFSIDFRKNWLKKKLNQTEVVGHRPGQQITRPTGLFPPVSLLGLGQDLPDVEPPSINRGAAAAVRITITSYRRRTTESTASQRRVEVRFRLR